MLVLFLHILRTIKVLRGKFRRKKNHHLLEELIVYPKGDIELLKSPYRKNIRVAIKGKSKIVSQINLDPKTGLSLKHRLFYSYKQ